MRLKQYILTILLFSNIFLDHLTLSQPVSIERLITKHYNFDGVPEFINRNDSLDILDRWAWGICFTADLMGDISVIGNGASIQILNLINPSQPQIISEYITDGLVYDLEISEDSILFAAVGNGLLILDISDPANPLKLSVISIGDIIQRVALDREFVYVLTFIYQMYVIDVSDPGNPVIRGSIGTNGRSTCIDAKDGYAYIGNLEFPAMSIVNATNPDSLLMTTFGGTGRVWSVNIKDTLLFTGTSALTIYNISELSLPVFLGSVQIADSASVDAIGTDTNAATAYVLCSSPNPNYIEGVYSIDISNAANPFIKDKFEKESGYLGIRLPLYESRLVAPFFTGACIIDVTDPDSLELNSFFPTSHLSEKVEVEDSIIFVASAGAGLWILEIEEGVLIPISNIQTTGYIYDVVVDDTLAYLINWPITVYDSAQGLWIINIADLNHPYIISHYTGIVNPSGILIPNCIAKENNYVVITQPTINSITNIFEVVDVSNPYVPLGLGIIQDNYRIYDLVVKYHYAYLATSLGLRIIDISDPDNPLEVNNFRSMVRFNGLYIKDNYAYTTITDTMFILNISNPTEPEVTGTLSGSFGNFKGVDITVEDQFLYWIERELSIVDISDPGNPQNILTQSTLDVTRGVAAFEDKIIVTDYTQGVWLMKNNLISDADPLESTISTYNLYQNYPNPFNPVTTIRYDLPKTSNVSSSVYDLLGRKVKDLVNNELKQPGTYEVTFDASGLASGVYFYRIQANEYVATKKMIVVK